MAAADIVHPAVAGDIGHHLDADLFQILADQPDLAGQVEVAQDVDAVRRDPGRIPGAHQLEHRLAGRLVAGPFVALEPLGLDRQDRNIFFLGHCPANRLEIVADDTDDTGGVDKGGLGPVPVDQLDQGRMELFLAAEDHVYFLEIGGKRQPVQLRARRQGAADIPGVDRTADGAVDQVQGVGNGVEHHPGAAEHAGPLAHRPGQAVLVAINVKGRIPLAMDLCGPFL